MRNRNQSELTAEKAARLYEELSVLVSSLRPSKLAIILAWLVAGGATISEFFFGYEIFYRFYLDSVGNETASTTLLTAGKSLLFMAMLYPTKGLWVMLHEFAGGDLPFGKRSKQQKFISTAAKVTKFTIFTVGMVLVISILGNMGFGAFTDLASLYQPAEVKQMGVNGGVVVESAGYAQGAAEHIQSLWPALIVSAFAASLALSDLQIMGKRKDKVKELGGLMARCKLIPELEEELAGLGVAKDYISSKPFSRNLMFERQMEVLEAFHDGLRAARDFLLDSRDPTSEIVFEDGAEYAGGGVIVPERDKRLKLVDEAEKNLKKLRLIPSTVMSIVGQEWPTQSSAGHQPSSVSFSIVHNSKTPKETENEIN